MESSKKKCVVCNRKLRLFETNLCSCNSSVCIYHTERDLHDCPLNTKLKIIDAVVASKVSKI